MRRVASAFILLFGFWLALSYSLKADFLVAGVLFTALALFFSYGKYPRREWLLNPIRLFWLAIYIPYFLYYCLKANMDVAYRVLHPDVPIKPGIVKVRTELKTKLAKTFLANSITLTPGTLTVDMAGQDLYVHWINIQTLDPEEQTEIVVKRFEGFLKRIFE